jgi:hypothetical protein
MTAPAFRGPVDDPWSPPADQAGGRTTPPDSAVLETGVEIFEGLWALLQRIERF